MRYSIIYADPPWQYDDQLGNDPKYGGITYATMKTRDIANLPVKDIRADNSLLFMWVTLPKLEDGFTVLRKWGFEYVTTVFIWIKIYDSGIGKEIHELDQKDLRTGTGRWTNTNAEMVLLGKHGTMQRLNTNVKQLIISKINGHSAKPTETRDRIIQLAGDLPRVELFAREYCYGWTSLGNALDGMDICDSISELAYVSIYDK